MTITTTFPVGARWVQLSLDDVELPSDTEDVAETYISVDEAREKLGGVGRQRIYELIRAGRLKAIKDPETRTWIISEESVKSFSHRGKGGRPRNKPL